MVYHLHYSLFLPGNIGKTVMGSVGLAWMINCLTGFYLTLPRGKPFWRKWRSSWQLKHRARGHRRIVDLHRAPGLWLWPMLFVMAFTGMALSLESQLFRPVLALLLPSAASEPAAPSSNWASRPIGYSTALARGQHILLSEGLPPPGWTRIALDKHMYHIRFDTRTDAGLHTSEVLVDGNTGSVIRARTAGTRMVGDVILDLRLPVHSGRVGGLAGRLMVSITGLVVALLSTTGVTIWWRKRAAFEKGSLSRAATDEIRP